jgi:hypothetical protein
MSHDENTKAGAEGPPAGTEPRMIRIVAALIIPTGNDEPTITLVNTTPGSTDMSEWTLTNDAGMRVKVGVSDLGPGDAVRVKLTGQKLPVEGILSLFDPLGQKAHSVSYTKWYTKIPGWTLLFAPPD